MKNMPREKIEQIAENILSNGDVLAKHGTTLNNAISIINTGFNYSRTSFVVQTSKNVEALCGYGWKDNAPDDATNVVIQVPREFIKDLLGMNDEEYARWLKRIKDNNMEENVFDIVTTFEEVERPKISIDSKIPMPIMKPPFLAHIPQEFIVGAFVWCNGKTYLNLGKDESPLDNLAFIPNENFYLNMQEEDKKEYISQMRAKLGLDSEGRKTK